MLYTLQGFLLLFARHPTPTTEDMKITLSQFAVDAISTADTEKPSINLKKGVNKMSNADAEKLLLCLMDCSPHMMDGRARRALENKIYEIEQKMDANH